MGRCIRILLTVCLLFSLAACGKAPAEKPKEAPQPEPDGPSVGICLPEDSQQWKENARLLQRELQALGFEVATEYAQNDPQMQLKQIKALAEEQVSCLVIAPVDAMALAQELENNDLAGIPVVAYDRQLQSMETANAAVGFNYFVIGQSLGEYIVSVRKPEQAQQPLTVEFIMGSAEDDRAVQLHADLLGVLQPCLDAGTFVCPSGRTAFADTYTLQEDPQAVKQKLSKTLAEQYQDRQLDILCVASDDMAAACVEVLADAGYTEENWPLITGQGGCLEAIKQIIAGRQTVTVYKDRPSLAKLCAQKVDGLVNGTDYAQEGFTDGTDITVYTVDITNYEELLVKTGIYEKQELK